MNSLTQNAWIFCKQWSNSVFYENKEGSPQKWKKNKEGKKQIRAKNYSQARRDDIFMKHWDE